MGQDFHSIPAAYPLSLYIPTLMACATAAQTAVFVLLVRGRVASVDRYTAAVKLLFDPDNAQVDLLSLEVKVSRARRVGMHDDGMASFSWYL